MGLRTGNPKGRPKGAKNKINQATREAAKKVAKKIELRLPGAFDGNAHAFMMLVYKDPSLPIDIRLEAAKSAAKYETPALSSVEMTGKDGSPLHPTAPPTINVHFGRRNPPLANEPTDLEPEGTDAQ